MSAIDDGDPQRRLARQKSMRKQWRNFTCERASAPTSQSNAAIQASSARDPSIKRGEERGAAFTSPQGPLHSLARSATVLIAECIARSALTVNAKCGLQGASMYLSFLGLDWIGLDWEQSFTFATPPSFIGE